MAPKCVINGCQSKYSDQEIRFIGFPSDKQLRKKWFNICGLEETGNLPKDCMYEDLFFFSTESYFIPHSNFLLNHSFINTKPTTIKNAIKQNELIFVRLPNYITYLIFFSKSTVKKFITFTFYLSKNANHFCLSEKERIMFYFGTFFYKDLE